MKDVLPNIRVASPCTVDWGAMTPVDGERVRACGQCKKNVYNLSNMTRVEAEALLTTHERELCVRYFQRKDGTIVLQDCLVRRTNRLVAVGAAALLAVGVAPLLTHDHSAGVAAANISIEPDVADVPPHASLAAHDDSPPAAPIDPVPSIDSVKQRLAHARKQLEERVTMGLYIRPEKLGRE